MINEILKYNNLYVKNKEYEKYSTSKFPDKKIAIVTCMDTRLTELLPSALGIRNGDAKIIKNAGGIITNPFGSAMRGLLIGIYEFEIDTILVIGHTDCGARITQGKRIIEKMKRNGIPQKKFEELKKQSIDLESWLEGFVEQERSIQRSVELVKNHPLVPEQVMVYGFLMDTLTGELKKIT
ncbi:beta-class carbonic anhydrase [Anaeromicropila populeti]|uniref:carbonic anhydrase n=1 Tax=Anaeromicropila populeti TaxID=37658 RepID=A0A1I6KAW2_9FIRM|nr:carbonic anhydrase [Anaeromicropila populeti]SFR88327.1 carbonic anhydrase [Anaeromicropila populeti]